MKKIDIFPEMGYLLNAQSKTISIITKAAYLDLIESAMQKQESFLWRETNLINLLFEEFGVTQTSELEISDPSQFAFLKKIKEQNWKDDDIFYAVDNSQFSTEKNYTSMLKAALALNQKYSFGLLFFNYSWELFEYVFNMNNGSEKILYEDQLSKLRIKSLPLHYKNLSDGSVTSTSEFKFCSDVEKLTGLSIFEAITFEEHLEGQYGVNNLYDLEKVDLPGLEAYLEYYQQFLADNAGDYLAPLYFALNESGTMSNLNPNELKTNIDSGHSVRTMLAISFAKASIPNLKNTHFSWNLNFEGSSL